MFDLGDLVPLAREITDVAGNPGNSSNIALTVTLPDGSTVSPTIDNPVTGRYQADYQPPMPGRYLVRWVATGTNASGFTDTFDVRDAIPPYIVSLADAKQHLNMDPADPSDDEELRGFIEATTRVVEDVVGPVVVRTISEVHQPGRLLALRNRPVITLVSVQQIRLNGISFDVTQLDLDPETGIVRPIYGTWGLGSWGYGGSAWPCAPLRAIYTAGRRIIPANHTLAAKVIIAHMWETQRGHTQTARRSVSSRAGMTDPDALQAGIAYTATGYMIPRRALELLEPDRRYQVMA